MNIPKQTYCLINDLTQDVIIFKYENNNYCFLKTEVLKYCNEDSCDLAFGQLLGNIQDILDENKTIQVWNVTQHLGDLNTKGFMIDPHQLKMLTKRKDALKDASKSKVDDCSILKRGIVKRTRYIAKTDDNIDNELDVYKKLNYGPRNFIMPNIAMLYGVGQCEAGKYLIIEKGDIDYAKYIRDNKITATQYRNNLVQLLFAYQYMLNNGYAHTDFKPNNVVIVIDGNIDHMIYNLYDKYYCIPNHGYTVKLIDFGITKKPTRLAIIKDLIRFIELSKNEASIAQNTPLVDYIKELLLVVQAYRSADDISTDELVHNFINRLVDQQYLCSF